MAAELRDDSVARNYRVGAEALEDVAVLDVGAEDIDRHFAANRVVHGSIDRTSFAILLIRYLPMDFLIIARGNRGNLTEGAGRRRGGFHGF